MCHREKVPAQQAQKPSSWKLLLPLFREAMIAGFQLHLPGAWNSPLARFQGLSVLSIGTAITQNLSGMSKSKTGVYLIHFELLLHIAQSLAPRETADRFIQVGRIGGRKQRTKHSSHFSLMGRAWSGKHEKCPSCARHISQGPGQRQDMVFLF